MFNKDFFPTPLEVIDQMIFGLELHNKTVLEPHGGKGDIIDVLKQNGAKVLTCEKSEELAAICSQKADKFLKHDFLQVQEHEISHIDYIVANPPFSQDDKHIQYMWDIAPEGCTIIALCNNETVKNQYSRSRRTLSSLIKYYGNSQYLGDCFSTAERKTDVEVALITLYKPSTGENEFDGYFDMSDEYESQENGLMKHSEIKEIVQRYVSAVKMFEDVDKINKEINQLISPISTGSNISFGGFKSDGRYQATITREEFKKELQKSAWQSVFNKLNMEKYVTSSVMSDINKFVEKQTNVPFTVKNIMLMMQMIVGTQGQRMERVIVEAFDDITKHHYNNRYQKEGWKTNSEYMVNKKFIMGSMDFQMSWGGKAEPSYRHGRSYFMDDLTKALCFVTGTKYDKCENWREFMDNYQIIEEIKNYKDQDTGEIKEWTSKKNKPKKRDYGTWYEFNFVRFKVFKKGTMHVEFLDDKVWEEFNKIACKAKGFSLATKYTSDFRKKETGVEIY